MKRTTPFKAPADFEKELAEFSNRHKITLAEHSKQISDYFEMTCYNLVVQYYEKLGYEVVVQNLKGGMFKYKCSPKGFLQNFSYFKAIKTNGDVIEDIVYIFHNATVQSAFDDYVYTTPDVVISKSDKPSETTDHYVTKLKLTYINRDNLVSFCEAKHYNPHPELMINFIGTVHELKPNCLKDGVVIPGSEHLAPSLMMSGTIGKPTRKIKESLESRYYINFFDSLFDMSAKAFLTKRQMGKIATLGRKCVKDTAERPEYPMSNDMMDLF
jgi:hypothetical protein